MINPSIKFALRQDSNPAAKGMKLTEERTTAFDGTGFDRTTMEYNPRISIDVKMQELEQYK